MIILTASFLYLRRKETSWAHWWYLQNLRSLQKSPVYKERRRGPRILPWGTPLLIAMKSQKYNAVWSLKYLTFVDKTPWSNISKALVSDKEYSILRPEQITYFSSSFLHLLPKRKVYPLISTVGQMPQISTKYLHLLDPQAYRDHCHPRSPGSHLTKNGVAEGYAENSAKLAILALKKMHIIRKI